VGTVIGQLLTDDPDVGQTHSYTLVDNARGRVSINGNTLQVMGPDHLCCIEMMYMHSDRLLTTQKSLVFNISIWVKDSCIVTCLWSWCYILEQRTFGFPTCGIPLTYFSVVPECIQFFFYTFVVMNQVFEIKLSTKLKIYLVHLFQRKIISILVV
jgi:hypothetical protein